MEERFSKDKSMVILLFFFSVIFRFVCAAHYPWTIHCYPDELLYISLAESLWNHGELMIYHLPSYFFKAGYPALIAPAFAIHNLQLRGAAIALINAGWVSLGIFPVYGLSKKILKQSKWIRLSVICYVICPTLTYSMTFMSEVLYLPLALTLIYVIFLLLDADTWKKRWTYGLLAAVLLIPAYITKGIALVFPAAFFLLALTILAKKQYDKDKKRCFVFLAVFLLCAAIFFLLMLQKPIYIAGIDLQPAMIRWKYALFGALFFAVSTVLAFFVIPVILPALCHKYLTKSEKRLYLFLLYMIAVLSVVVSLMIYVKEDYPSLTPRVHIRYIEYAFLPFLILLFRIFEKKEAVWSEKALCGALTGYFAIELAVFRGFSGKTMDTTMLFYWQLFSEDGHQFLPYKVRICSLLLFLALLFVCLLCKANKKRFVRISIAGIMIFCVGNGIMSTVIQYMTHVGERMQMEEIEQMREFSEEHIQDTLLIIEAGKHSEWMDTYLADCENVMVVSENISDWYAQSGGSLQEGLCADIYLPGGYYKGPLEVDYILLDDTVYDMGEGGELLKRYEHTGYALYKNQTPSTLPEIRR